jgi:tetratricopeptide (TPR) repeat protein
MMMRLSKSSAMVLAALIPGILGLTSVADAASPSEALNNATRRIVAAEKDAASVERVVRNSGKHGKSAEERIADAVLLMGVKDYERAADVLNQIIEKWPNHRTVSADGMHLLGETYFKSKQYLSAKRVFTHILDHQDESHLRPFRERAAVRLVDVALRMRDLSNLDALFAKIGSISGAQSGLAYAKGKGLLAQGKLQDAAISLQAVTPNSEFVYQSKYLEGVVATQEATPPPPPEGTEAPPLPKGTFAAALQHFTAVTKMAGDTPEHRHIIDMAWLAVGRLLYESNQWSQSVDAYNRIQRDSPEFGTMLFELAWVYVRLGDMVRAQRALEVLAVASPNSQDVADASLLRGDLMLRAGKFEKSRKVYESVRDNYEGMRARLDVFLGSTDDPGVYFDTLSKEQFELFESGGALPELVLKWAREGEDGATAFAIIDDVALSRRLIKESNEMIERLNAVLSSPNKIRALPALKAGAERGLGLLNGVAIARMNMAHGMDDTDDSVSGALKQARDKRQSLERRLGLIPVTSADFAGRERQATRQWNKTSQGLQRLELEINTLQATVNGLNRMITDSPQAGVVRSPQQIQQFKHSLTEQKRLIKYYRDQVSQIRRAIEAGKVQVGFGDKRFVEDAQVRKQYVAALWAEVRLAQRAGGSLANYARRISPVLQRADKADQRVEAALAQIDAAVEEKAGKLRAAVQRETVNIVEYSLGLEELDKEARLVVGEVAMRNFGLVRKRLGKIVMRADVGITEEAWELREEQITRVRRLKIEKARAEQRLAEELEEVLDDSGDED